MEIGRSREQVASALETLNDTYDSFPVRQSTVNVDQESYDRAVKRCELGIVDACVRVRHDDGVLVLETNDVEQTPRGTIESSDPSIEAGACRLVKELTGVSCYVTDLVGANIVGIHPIDDSSTDREPVYRLIALFEAAYDDGDLCEGAAWHASIPPIPTLS